ncbi:MAG: prepilin-type N-terminal cleavage/methylation domain-containing protein [Terrimicrobiaceae bacterium]|nr:prepilin-type N-terminal cleavage/methylation domain-containing protein [Terrimicrobiaceae bacterium]
MTTSANKARARTAAYTLLEVLLAIAIVAILLGITVPMFSGAFGASESDSAIEALEKTAAAARSSALESGTARRVRLTDRGLVPDSDDIPPAELPAGWKLEVRRLTESKLRRPAKNEFWEFNGAGICEPITLSAGDGLESITVTFDPLTALVIRDE